MTTATSYGAAHSAVLKEGKKIQIGSYGGLRSRNSVGLCRRHVNLFSVSIARPNPLIRAVSTVRLRQSINLPSSLPALSFRSCFLLCLDLFSVLEG